MDKIEKFENFTIEIEVKTEEEESEEEIQEVGCGCCDDCNGEEGCECCDDCNCGTEEVNPESDVKVMNIQDFIGSLNK
jgi:hypothetical protein